MTPDPRQPRRPFALTRDLPPAQARAARRNLGFLAITLVITGVLVLACGIRPG